MVRRDSIRVALDHLKRRYLTKKCQGDNTESYLETITQWSIILHSKYLLVSLTNQFGLKIQNTAIAVPDR